MQEIAVQTWRAVAADVVHAKEGWTNLIPVSVHQDSTTHSKSSTIVGDDLYLALPKPQNNSGAVKVVRGYLACAPEAEADAELQRTANQTASLRAKIYASPLPVLAVVNFGTHPERLSLLRAYEHYFARVVYMSPSPSIADELRDHAKQRPVARAATYHCSWPIKVTPLANMHLVMLCAWHRPHDCVAFR